LSLAQKRDLVGQALAAVITTALIAAPLIHPPDAALPAQSFAGPVSAIAIAEAQLPPALQVTPAFRRAERTALARANVRPAGRLSGRPLSASLAPVAAALEGVALPLPHAVGTSGSVQVTPEPPARAARKPLSRRLGGWLIGDGTHSVRPFPSVASSRP
jgi:hypothetical protein